MDLLDPDASLDYSLQCIKWCAQNDDVTACREHIRLHGHRLTEDPGYTQELCDLLKDACNKGKTDISIVLLNCLEREVKSQLPDNKSWFCKLLYNVVVSGNTCIVKDLVSKGANVNGVFCGKPVIHIAACCGYLDVLNELLHAGAHIHSTDQRGNGIIHNVLSSQLENKVEIVREIMRYGADPRVKSSSGKLPIHCAASNSPEVLELLLQEGHDVNAVDDINKETPLHIACGIACKETIVKLIHFGCKFNVVNNKGETPLAKLLRFTNDFHDFHSKTRLKMAKRLVRIGFRMHDQSLNSHKQNVKSKGTVRGRDKTYDRYTTIKQSIRTPAALQDLARGTVRASLAVSKCVHKHVSALDIPLNLIPYILHHDFQFDVKMT